MLKYVPKIPTNRQWEMLKQMDEEPVMDPETFLRFWSVSYRELALISGVGLSVVKCWFAPCRKVKPAWQVQRRLYKVHRLWSCQL